MAIADQIAYAQSLMDNICALLVKLDKPFDSFVEPGVHAFLYQMRIVPAGRSSFDEYSKHELQRTIGRLKLIFAQYEKKLAEKDDAQRLENQQRIDAYRELRENEAAILRDCLPRERADEWMQLNARHYKLIEHFTWAGVINRITYWRKREQPVRLLTFTEAKKQYDGLKHRGGEFDDWFEESKETGWPEILYKPRYSTTVRHHE